MRYGAYDLAIESEIAVPGAPRAEGEPALRVVLGTIAAPGEDWRGTPPYRLAPNGQLLIEIVGVARYLVDLRRKLLTVEPCAEASQEDVGALLIATALPAALWLRGDLVLHAATVVLPGETCAVAIAGPSGSGKSTLLRRSIAAGGLVVGDDTLCLREDAGGFRASGLPAATQLRLPRPAAERQLIPVPAMQQRRSARLGAVVVLGRAGVVGLTRLHGAEALTAILRNLHRPRVPELAGLAAGMLPRLASLASEVGVYSWGLESEDSALPDVRTLDAILPLRPTLIDDEAVAEGGAPGGASRELEVGWGP